MTINIEKMAIGHCKYFFVAKKSGNLPYGISGVIANGGDAGMLRASGFVNLPITVPEVRRSAIVGDGSKLGTFVEPSIDPITGQGSFVVLDLNLAVATDGRSIFADGDFDAILGSQRCKSLATLCAVANMKADSQAAGSLNEKGWFVIELWNIQADEQFPGLSGTAIDAIQHGYGLTFEEVDTELTGLTVNSTNYGVDRAWYKAYWSENPVTFHTHKGDNADTGFTLLYTPAADNTNKFKAWQTGSPMTYGAGAGNITNTGTAVTFGTAPGTGVETVARYEFLDVC